MRIFDTFMFRNELDMLECRLRALEHDSRVIHVLTESEHTHLGVAKPLFFRANIARFFPWADRIVTPLAPEFRVGTGPWAYEHAQRNAAMAYIDRVGDPGDLVLICDCDEIPSQAVLDWEGIAVASVRMRTCLFAVDWEVSSLLPATCVVATVDYLRKAASYGHGLGEVRDGRDSYPEIADGGWHLSWLGGPESQREKLYTATCHQEVLQTPEAFLIASGARWRNAEAGGGLPVKPVDVDESWPEYVWKRQCPENWFRPREA